MVSGITPCAQECKWMVYFGECPKTANGPSRGRSVLPVLPRYLASLVWLCVPFALATGSLERRERPLSAGRLYPYGRHAYT